MFRNQGLLVGNQLEQLTRQDFCFSQMYAAQRDWQHKETQRFSLSEEENPYIMFSMHTFKLPEHQPGFSCLKMLTAIFERTQGFLTPFYELEYNVKTSRDTERIKAECKKGFYVPLNIKDGDFRAENLFFAVMITDESDKQQKRCKAAGTVKFSNIIGQFEKKEDQESEEGKVNEESFVVKMSPTRDMNFTAIEIINKSLGDGLGDGGTKYFNVKFKTKMVPSSTLNDNDSVLDRVKIPSLLSPKVNQISLSIEKAKIRGPVFMGDFFGVSIEVEVIDAKGKSVACIKNVDSGEVDVYRSLISPSNEKCDWREQLRLDLLAKGRKGADGLRMSLRETQTTKENNWKRYHLRLSIYKVAENSKKKRFGFSFLPLFTAGNIVKDDTHQLFVFQQDGSKKEAIPNPEEYLQKEFIYDEKMPNAVLKTQKGTNFNPGTGSFLAVKTRVSSTMITEDCYINALLSLDADQAFDDQINDTFDQFINNASPDSQAKRILFMEDLLEKLWSVLRSQPNQKDRIFQSFIEIVRPIVMVGKDFGYAAKHLEEYLMDKFKSTEVFSSFIEAFSDFITDKTRTTGAKANYTMMSLKYIFQIIVQSYKLNKASNPNFECAEFLDMMSLLRDFLQEKDTGKGVTSKRYGFKTLFEVDTINTVTEIFPAKDLIDILEALLADTRENKDQETLTLNVMSKVIKSNLFNDPESQKRLCRIALELGTHQLKREERHKSFGAKSQMKPSAFKEKTLELLKDLYEACRKPGPGEDARKEFVKEITVEVLPRLTLLLPVKVSIQKNQQGKRTGKEKERSEKKLDEIMFFTLLSEVNDELFDRIYEQTNSEKVFEHLFKLAIQTDGFSFPEDSFELQLMSLKFFIKFLGFVCAKGIMNVTKGDYILVELYLEAASSLISSPNLALEKFPKEKRARVQDKFGDQRKDLAQIMKNTILGISKEDILELLTKDFYGAAKSCRTLEALFSAITKTPEEDDTCPVGAEKTQDERNCLISIVFEVLIAEFFSREAREGEVKINGELFCCYTWFISQIIGTNAEKEIFNLRDSFFQRINDNLKDFEGSWKTRADLAEVAEEQVQAFVTKSKMWIKHLQELTKSTRDVKRVQSRKSAKAGKSQQYYFGEITSLYYKYKVLKKAKEEATAHELLDKEEEKTPFKDECIVVLQSLYNIFDHHCLHPDEAEDGIKDDYVSAGFTLDELSPLIDWSEERCSLPMDMWIRVCAERAGVDHPAIKRVNFSWSEAKEAITALAIKKFKDAAGFECSVEMMEKSILRYKTEVFEFRELANAYRNLANIYEYRVDFNAKLKDEEAGKKKELENARRNVINPTYFNIGFYNTSTTIHLRFLEGKSFIYRADAMVKPVDMWNMLQQWFPFATIEKERIKEDKKKSLDGNKMVVECFLVSPHNIPDEISLILGYILG